MLRQILLLAASNLCCRIVTDNAIAWCKVTRESDKVCKSCSGFYHVSDVSYLFYKVLQSIQQMREAFFKFPPGTRRMERFLISPSTACHNPNACISIHVILAQIKILLTAFPIPLSRVGGLNMNIDG